MSIIRHTRMCITWYPGMVLLRKRKWMGYQMILSPQHKFKLATVNGLIPVLCYSKTILDTQAMVYPRQTNFLGNI